VSKECFLIFYLKKNSEDFWLENIAKIVRIFQIEEFERITG